LHRTHNAIPLRTALVRAQLDAITALFFLFFLCLESDPESPQKYYYGSRSSNVSPEQDYRYWSSSRVGHTKVRRTGKIVITEEQKNEYNSH